jgi:hypothetical protein
VLLEAEHDVRDDSTVGDGDRAARELLVGGGQEEQTAAAGLFVQRFDGREVFGSLHGVLFRSPLGRPARADTSG